MCGYWTGADLLRTPYWRRIHCKNAVNTPSGFDLGRRGVDGLTIEFPPPGHIPLRPCNRRKREDDLGWQTTNKNPSVPPMLKSKTDSLMQLIYIDASSLKKKEVMR